MSEDVGRMLDPAEIRWKMAVACDVCRKRKVRCDGERPCSRCAKGSIECRFSLPKHVTRKGNDAGPSKRKSTSVGAESRPDSKRRTMTDGHINTGVATSAERAATNTMRPSSPTAIFSPRMQHLLLIDRDDQLIYSGPSTGMPLFARLGLLHTVEVIESEKDEGDFQSHSVSALGLTGAISGGSDYYDLCLAKCPQELMFTLIGLHFGTPVFFPLLHSPSFLAEFVAVTNRRLPCTPQYAALLMSILAITASLVKGSKEQLPECEQYGDSYHELAKDLLRASTNKLDIRHILALYHLAIFAEGRGAAGEVTGFVSEALGLAITTGIHRNTGDFQMDPVTAQIRTRLFWGLYAMNISLAYSQGRPSLIPLAQCSVEFPAIVDNDHITKTEIIPQSPDHPAVVMAGNVKILEIYIILEQALTIINAPSRTLFQEYSLDDQVQSRRDRLQKAEEKLEDLEKGLPSYLANEKVPEVKYSNGSDRDVCLSYIMSSRVRSTFIFARTLIARQALIEEFEGDVNYQSSSSPSEATEIASRLSVECIEIYEMLRELDYLQYCGYNAVSHITAAGHTLIACMIRSTDLATSHRNTILSAISLLDMFKDRYPAATPATNLLKHMSRTLGLGRELGGESEGEALAIRVLARKMAISPPHQTSTLPHMSDKEWETEQGKVKTRRESVQGPPTQSPKGGQQQPSEPLSSVWHTGVKEEVKSATGASPIAPSNPGQRPSSSSSQIAQYQPPSTTTTSSTLPIAVPPAHTLQGTPPDYQPYWPVDQDANGVHPSSSTYMPVPISTSDYSPVAPQTSPLINTLPHNQVPGALLPSPSPNHSPVTEYPHSLPHTYPQPHPPSAPPSQTRPQFRFQPRSQPTGHPQTRLPPLPPPPRVVHTQQRQQQNFKQPPPDPSAWRPLKAYFINGSSPQVLHNSRGGLGRPGSGSSSGMPQVGDDAIHLMSAPALSNVRMEPNEMADRNRRAQYDDDIHVNGSEPGTLMPVVDDMMTRGNGVRQWEEHFSFLNDGLFRPL